MGVEGVSRASHEAQSLRDYLQVLRRRRWIVLQAVVLVPLAAVLVSLRQAPVYQSSAEVLLSRQNLAMSLTGTVDPSTVQPERLLQTQADLAETPEVARRVLAAAGLKDRTPQQLIDRSWVTAKKNADLLVFSVTDRDSKLASRLATEYARQFTIYNSELATASLKRARKEVQERIADLERRGERSSALYTSLVDKEQQLRTIEALQTSNAFVVKEAGRAHQVRPRPERNGLIALVLGLVLGIGLAFLWEALDTRVRSTEEIERRLGLPLLARLPEPPRWLQSTNRLVMLAEPNGVEAEAFRMLRTNFDFFNMERGARTVMVTSAVGEEGKSTTVANLAIALSRAGQRVVLVDFDLRRPILDRFFDCEGQPGLTDVVLGRARLGPAVPTPERSGALTAGEDGQVRSQGSLEVLTSGVTLENADEFVSSQALGEILEQLRERADIVLVDAPPLLVVGDSMALTAHMDAVIIVTRLNLVRRHMLDELRRVLDACPTATLGFVVTGAEQERGYSYGYGYGRYSYAPYASAGKERRT